MRAVFFDLDDTLIDSRGAIAHAAEALRKRLALDVAPQVFATAWSSAHARHYPHFLDGRSAYREVCRRRIRDCIDPDVSDADADELFSIYMGEYEGRWRLFDDVLPCLAALSEFSLGVITNGPSQEQRRKLTRLGIAARFHSVVVSEECGSAKPHHAIFARACELAGSAAADMIYIGDQHDTDYHAARLAGLKSIWLNRGTASQSIARADTITSLLALPEILARVPTMSPWRSPL
jgi:putative hydrolase of the HAD superfamily